MAKIFEQRGRWITGALALLLSRICASAAQLEVLEVAGRTLHDNQLHDPVARRVAVFVPQNTKPGASLPVVYFLPGFGSSSEDFIAQGNGSAFARLVQQLADNGLPLILAIPDCRNRWGGSQYLNSTAQGNYADYLADEVVPAVEAQHPAAKRIIAGHSSGGYGALMLAMARPKLFGAVVALSADSDFEVTHRKVVEQPEISRVTPKDVEAFTAPRAKPPADGLVALILGLSAAYAPAGPPGRINWLYDDAGHFQKNVWQQWLEKDPLLIVRAHEDAFDPQQRVYLDGAAHDEWGFNVSARLIFDVLRKRASPVTFHEPPGGHSDGIPERLVRGITWVLR